MSPDSSIFPHIERTKFSTCRHLPNIISYSVVSDSFGNSLTVAFPGLPVHRDSPGARILSTCQTLFQGSPTQGFEPRYPALQTDYLLSEPSRKPSSFLFTTVLVLLPAPCCEIPIYPGSPTTPWSGTSGVLEMLPSRFEVPSMSTE